MTFVTPSFSLPSLPKSPELIQFEVVRLIVLSYLGTMRALLDIQEEAMEKKRELDREAARKQAVRADYETVRVAREETVVSYIQRELLV